jgi:hypothetical protein
VDARVVINIGYLWNRSPDGCHYTSPFIESTENGKKGRKKKEKNEKEQQRKKGNEEKQESEKWIRVGETERWK